MICMRIMDICSNLQIDIQIRNNEILGWNLNQILTMNHFNLQMKLNLKHLELNLTIMKLITSN